LSVRRGIVAAGVLGILVALSLAGGSYGKSGAFARDSATGRLTVQATANIFGAGRSAAPPGKGGVGTRPPGVLLPKGEGRILTFSSVSGKITCCKTGSNFYNRPEGRSDFPTDVTGAGGISGVKSKRSMFLAGVSLGPEAPGEAPPTRTHTRLPELGQVFYIGNGQGAGGPVEFGVPDSATRLFLGIADGFNFVGAPSYYGDNAGSFAATFDVVAAGRKDVIFRVLAKEELKASKVNELLADARLGGAGRIVDLTGEHTIRGVFSLTLVWLHRDDGHLTLRPVGGWPYSKSKRVLYGSVEVVKSDEPRCPKGYRLLVGLRQNPDLATVALTEGGCGAFRQSLSWREPGSAIAVSVEEVRVRVK
jgi:hypothetical protein